MEWALRETSDGDRLLLNIAFNYAGRTEPVDAVRKLIASGVDPETVDEATIGDALYTAGMPDPDLVIRTGGEQRLSNFPIWQSAYAEFYWCETLWPDFGPEAFDALLWNSRDDIGVTVADRAARRDVMRERAIGAAILLCPFCSSCSRSAARCSHWRSRSSRQSRPWSCSGCCAPPATIWLPALGTVLALTIVVDAASPDVLDGSGLLLSAIGIVLIAVAAFTRQDPRDGLGRLDRDSVRGALCLADGVRHPPGHVAPAVPDGAPLEFLGGERGWILLLILAVWSYDTEPCSSASSSADRSS